MSLLFRIWYGGGTTFTGHEPEDAYRCPGRNVQMVTTADADHGWFLVPPADYYWWLPDQQTWNSGDHFGLWDYLAETGMKRVLFGRTLKRSEFYAIVGRAQDDLEMLRKTGWQAGEREAAGIA